MDSMPTRDLGFEKVLSTYPAHELEQLLTFHRANGGLSRYVKFRYFFEQIRKESITEEKVQELAAEFSVVMRKELLNEKLLIRDSVEFVKRNHNRFKMYVVSGSDGNELRYLCETLGLSQYFISIHGSPTPKKELVGQLLKDQGIDPRQAVFIGDSTNDYDAAHLHHIDFAAYNNTLLKGYGVGYIDSFATIKI
jgi:HAD superfamily hydrolase (TIGR01549 family)